MPRYRVPSRFGPPEAVLPGVVPVEAVIGRTDDVAVCVGRIAAYPEGFQLELMTHARIDLDLDPFDFGYRRRGRGDGELDPELLRFGIEFADGRKATNVEGLHVAPDDELALVESAGGGGGGSWHQGYWVPELPPEGPLAFVAEWPAAGLALTRMEIDAAPIREAAGRSQVLWELPEAPPGAWDEDDDDF
jgi:hypothetical protein